MNLPIPEQDVEATLTSMTTTEIDSNEEIDIMLEQTYLTNQKAMNKELTKVKNKVENKKLSHLNTEMTES